MSNCNHCDHVTTINREMGEVKDSLKWIEKLIFALLGFAAANTMLVLKAVVGI